jgi:hypothetical protein
MTIQIDRPAVSFNRAPSSIEEFAAALESVRGGVGINPTAQREKYNMILGDMIQRSDLANLPDFNRTKIPGGESRFRQPVIPGEQRLTPEMREPVDMRRRLGPSLKEAKTTGKDFLDAYIPELLAQITPGSLRQIVNPQTLPYVKTPMDQELERRIMEQIIPGRSVDELRMLVGEV